MKPMTQALVDKCKDMPANDQMALEVVTYFQKEPDDLELIDFIDGLGSSYRKSDTIMNHPVVREYSKPRMMIHKDELIKKYDLSDDFINAGKFIKNCTNKILQYFK